MRRPAKSSGSSIRSRTIRSSTGRHRAVSIGVALTGPTAKSGGERRIIHGTSDGRLFSLDARNGKLDPKFGAGGILNLRDGLDPKVAALEYGPTSAPALCNDTIVVGVSCGEGPGIAAPGDIRAFDVHTGREVWRFRTVPGPGEFGNETWKGDSWKGRGAANAWGGFSIDARRGLIFAGLGSAAFDFYGGDRHGDNLFANCTIALEAKTGKRVWHFQTLRHDLWDHDLPVYPNLVTVTRNGKAIDAVAQVTKTGYVFLFDRETGKPLFDIEEKPVPASDIPGEQASPTQPIPVKPPPFAAQFLDETNITDIGESNRKSVLEKLRTIRGGPAFNPPSLQRNGRDPRLPRWSDLVRGLFRPDDRAAVRELEQRPEYHHAGGFQVRRQNTIRALRHDGL